MTVDEVNGLNLLSAASWTHPHSYSRLWARFCVHLRGFLLVPNEYSIQASVWSDFLDTIRRNGLDDASTTEKLDPRLRKAGRSWKRILLDGKHRFLYKSWNIAQLQYYTGTTLRVYEGWAKSQGCPVLVEEVGTSTADSDSVRLLWIGPRNSKRVILYFHGGGYVLPMQTFGASFWNYIRLKLNSERFPIGVAIMNYTLVPTARFPTQLTQAVETLKHVIANGRDPQDIFIVGDSAGANLILALFSHILHPVDNLPSLSLSSHIGGAYLMSPWTHLIPGVEEGSHSENESYDTVTARAVADIGRMVLEDVPESLHVYLEANKAPATTWFSGIDKLVKRILITAGEMEIMRDDIISVARNISEHHSDVEVIVQENGVHDDPFFDIPCDTTEKILTWFREGLQLIGGKTM